MGLEHEFELLNIPHQVTFYLNIYVNYHYLIALKEWLSCISFAIFFDQETKSSPLINIRSAWNTLHPKIATEDPDDFPSEHSKQTARWHTVKTGIFYLYKLWRSPYSCRSCGGPKNPRIWFFISPIKADFIKKYNGSANMFHSYRFHSNSKTWF